MVEKLMIVSQKCTFFVKTWRYKLSFNVFAEISQSNYGKDVNVFYAKIFFKCWIVRDKKNFNLFILTK